jgi:type IV pilus assembly protein PilE
MNFSTRCLRPDIALPDNGAIDRYRNGFTLVEMLVALVIAGILFFVALPGYQYAVLKSTRTAARGALLDLMSRQEQYFVNHKRYAIALPELGLPGDLYIDAQGEPVSSQTAVYRIQLELVDDSYHGARAVPLNRQSADSGCMTFSLSLIGVRSVSGTRSPADCW